jgi:hypothetical protein
MTIYTKICKTCGGEFSTTSKKLPSYCSDSCLEHASEKICVNPSCNKPFKYLGRKCYCCDKCKKDDLVNHKTRLKEEAFQQIYDTNAHLDSNDKAVLTCLECGFKINGDSLQTHIKNRHNLTPTQYQVKHNVRSRAYLQSKIACKVV